MSDENQPANAAPPRRTRRKKLPPLRGDDDNGENNLENSTTNQEGNGDLVPNPSKLRRKKRKPLKPEVQEQASADHAAGPVSSQQQLLPSDSQEGTKPRRKKRKPKTVSEGEPPAEDSRRSPEGQEGEAAQRDAAVMQTRYIDVEGMPLAKVLETVRDDVVTKRDGQENQGAEFSEAEENEQNEIEDDPMKLAGQARGESNISDTIFRQTQNTRAFKAEKIDKYQQRVDEERREREQYLQGEAEQDTSNRTLKCAIGFTKAYNYFGTLLIGFIGGFTAFHSLYCWLMNSGYLEFLKAYSNLSSPFSILFYVALTLILLSVFERYDTGKLDGKSCIECVSFRHAGMVVLLFLPGYVISNIMYPTDRWIDGYSRNATAYINLENGDSIVQSWLILDLIRTITLTIGWIVIAFNTQFNKLAINLESELDDLIGEDNVEMAAKTQKA